MECYYHPDRDGTDSCAICGKSVCKECGLELGGKIYCKDCLEKIIGLESQNKAAQPAQSEPVQEPVKTEPVRLNKQPAEESIYQTQNVAEEVPPAPEVQEIKQIRDDSPYNIKDNIEYSPGPESSYEREPVQPQVEQRPISQEPQIAQNEVPIQQNEIPQQAPGVQDEFIYPDHSYEPEPTTARRDLEDKYEKYLDDLYFDDNVPLGEQLAKDEEQYGSLTRKEYPEREETLLKDQKRAPAHETPEEMEARIRAEILAEKEGGKKGKDKNIHNLNYQEEKESMSAVDIVLTVLLVIIILVVIYYLIYVFILHSYYPTFMEAIYGLSNPQNVINNMVSPPPSV